MVDKDKENLQPIAGLASRMVKVPMPSEAELKAA